MNLPLFTASTHCQSRIKCHLCQSDRRAGRRFRKTMEKAYAMPGAGKFRCPFSPTDAAVPAPAKLIARVASGPGTELKRLLARIGINHAPNCSCNARAQEMDQRGPDWCTANLDIILRWLQEEAQRQRKPFVGAVARMIVRRAIRNSRKRRDCRIL